jgi:hypothetical protein
VTRLGENLTFGYFLFENFFTNEQFNIWFMVCILTFSTNWTEMYWIFFFWLKFWPHFQKLGDFLFNLLATLDVSEEVKLHKLLCKTKWSVLAGVVVVRSTPKVCNVAKCTYLLRIK